MTRRKLDPEFGDGRFVYTQHSVAFPTIEPWPGDRSVIDMVGVSNDHPGGGTMGEFHWRFYRFQKPVRDHVAVQVQVFGDGLDTFLDRRIQRVVKRWRDLPTPDAMSPAQLIAWLEAEHVVPSSHHRLGAGVL